jgi:DNA-directed RNA polymerase specialized sigma24 family protein
MELREAIAALPQPYSVALDLDDAGQPADAVAAALGIEVGAVPMVLRLGREKLARLLLEGTESVDPPPSPCTTDGEVDQAGRRRSGPSAS